MSAKRWEPSSAQRKTPLKPKNVSTLLKMKTIQSKQWKWTLWLMVRRFAQNTTLTSWAFRTWRKNLPSNYSSWARKKIAITRSLDSRLFPSTTVLPTSLTKPRKPSSICWTTKLRKSLWALFCLKNHSTMTS